jgi:GNAT superfamily N-acetyltransferase
MAEIVFEPEPQADTRAAILEGLLAYNAQKTENRFGSPRNIALALKDPVSGASVGGLTARVSYSRMFVELLFIPEHLRGQGFGEKLMTEAERVARDLGCIGIWLDTFSFQAPGFYKKLGYTEFGALPDYPPGFTRHFLHKNLS